MTADLFGQEDPGPERLRQRSLELRRALLALHKALIESERATFEKTMGAIQSPNHFLALLTSDPWFTWLQPLSSLIVSLDELLDQEASLLAADVDALMVQAARLIVPAEHGGGFSGHYFEALQRDPHVVLAHAGVMRSLGVKKS